MYRIQDSIRWSVQKGMAKGHQETLMRSSESPGYAESGSHVLLEELVGKVFTDQQKCTDPGYLKVQRKRGGDHS